MDGGFSVLRNLTQADIRRDPYPLIVVENCLPPELYQALERSYPDDDTILKLSGAKDKHVIRQNHRFDLRARDVLRNPGAVSRVWEDFVAHHVSHDFFREFVALFGPDVRAIHPGLEARLGARLEELTTGVRFDKEWDTGQVALDCQIGINTPVTRMSSSRSVHTDAPDELFAMLLYFPRPGDATRGGDLKICRWRPGVPHLFVGRDLDPGDTERVMTVPYRPNTLVAFVNSEAALHAVTPRAVSPLSRRLVNIVGRVQRSVPEGLFVKRQKKGLRAAAGRLVEKIADRTGRRY
jgi:hypothetical protein